MESVLSQHFGKTPVSTPFASQEVICDSPNGNDEIETDDGPHDINVILEGRVRDYLSHQEAVVEEDDESDDVDDTEDFAPGNDAEFSKKQEFWERWRRRSRHECRDLHDRLGDREPCSKSFNLCHSC